MTSPDTPRDDTPHRDGPDDPRLAALADLVNDEERVDWATESARSPELRSRLGGLELLDRIAAAHRNPFPDEDELVAGARFRWGHLHVRDALGRGAFGEVYRAFDPRLEREVALKLLRADADRGNLDVHRFLEEARRMARVRHDGVVTIHGADVHDGRPGFWSDLVSGETLDERLDRDGVLGAEEARSVGLELCRALAAVHDAGIVHGDVKAANVMRDDRGRILLMDFGAGTDSVDPGAPAGTGPAAARGTPLALAPEIFGGAAPSTATDLYALGILLYRLLTDAYPVEADTWESLEAAHAGGRRTPLRDRRPDLPTDLVQAIEGALDPDPRSRLATAGALEHALRADRVPGSATPYPAPASTTRGRRVTAVGALLAAGVAATILLVAGPQQTPREPASSIDPVAGSTPAPPVAGDIETAWYRTRRGERDAVPAGGMVQPGDGLCLEVRLPDARHVYVLNEDDQGRLYQLFPLDDLDLHNPLPADEWHRLPGPRAGTPYDWQVTSGAGRESFLVVASREPVDDLAAHLAGLAPARAGRPVETRPPDPLGDEVPHRGVGGLAPRTTSEEVGEGRLAILARRLVGRSHDPDGIWVRQRVLYNQGR